MNPARIAAVILAAGAASRFGSPKQLATFRGEPMLARTIRHARETGISRVIVVLGAYADIVAPALGATGDLTIVVNAEWPTGIASSIRAGLAAIQADLTDAVLILTADQPLIDARALAVLIDAFRSDCDIAATDYNGMPGVPAVIATPNLSDLARSLSGDRGAAAWLRSQGDRVTRVRIEDAMCDADTVEALSAIELM